MLTTTNINVSSIESQNSLAGFALSEIMERYLLQDDFPFTVLVVADSPHHNCKEILETYFDEEERARFEGSMIVEDPSKIPLDLTFDIVMTIGNSHHALLCAGIPPYLLVADNGNYIRVVRSGKNIEADNAVYGNGTPLLDMELDNRTAMYIHSIKSLPSQDKHIRVCRVRLMAVNGTIAPINIAVQDRFPDPKSFERFLNATLMNRNAGLRLAGFDPSHYYAAMYLVDPHSLIDLQLRNSWDLIGETLPKAVGDVGIEKYKPTAKRLKDEDVRVVTEACYRVLEWAKPHMRDVKERARVCATDAMAKHGKHLSPGDFNLIWADVKKAA